MREQLYGDIDSEALVGLSGLDDRALEGLSDGDEFGALKTSTGKLKPAAKNLARKAATKALADSTMTREQRIMGAKFKEFDDKTKQALRSGELKGKDADYYVRRWIRPGATSMMTLLEQSSEKLVGVTNFDKARLPDATNLVVSGLKISYAALYLANTVTDGQVIPTNPTQDTNLALLNYSNAAYQLSYSNSAFRPAPDTALTSLTGQNPGAQELFAVIPQALLNAEISIVTDNTVIAEMPLKRFFLTGWAPSVKVEGTDDIVWLKVPQLIKAGQAIRIMLRIPDGLALPGTRSLIIEGAAPATYRWFHALEVRMLGVETRPQ